MVVVRRAARALLLADRSVLLIKGTDPGRPNVGTWWLTPGGGVEGNESIEQAAVREVLEETGLRITLDDVGPVVATRVGEFEFEQRQYRQTEFFFAVRTAMFTPKIDGWDDTEQRALLDHRWWTVDELVTTDDKLYPAELADLVRTVLDGNTREVIELSGA